MEATTRIRLVTEGLNSEALFPPEKCLSIVWDHFGYTKNDQGVILNFAVKKLLQKSEYIRDNARLAVHRTILMHNVKARTTWREATAR